MHQPADDDDDADERIELEEDDHYDGDLSSGDDWGTNEQHDVDDMSIDDDDYGSSLDDANECDPRMVDVLTTTTLHPASTPPQLRRQWSWRG